MIEKLVAEESIHGIISDNRWGVRSKKIPSVFITHQLNVLSGNTSFISSNLHQNLIKKFDACWVPDLEGTINLSGTLGHFKDLLAAPFPVTYIGLLSRMQKKKRPIVYDVLCLLSGPEPQRTALEEKLISVFKNSEKQILLVQGVVEDVKKEKQIGAIKIINFLQSTELEKAINESEYVVSRSGYTTIMDLAAMEKKAFFIPTPGQFEQVYLAKQLKQTGFVPSCKQDEFEESKLHEIENYKGLKSLNSKTDFSSLFRFFERE